MIVLSGCAKNDEHIENEKLKVYSLDELFFYNEYSVSDLENLLVYFPVITNKKITSTELGGVSANFIINHFSTNEGSLTVKLIADNQNHTNIKYEDYYITFLKYKIKFTGDADISKYSNIILSDTQLWIFSGDEIQPINFADGYLKINIIDKTEKQSLIDWEEKINEMSAIIQSKL